MTITPVLAFALFYIHTMVQGVVLRKECTDIIEFHTHSRQINVGIGMGLLVMLVFCVMRVRGRRGQGRKRPTRHIYTHTWYSDYSSSSSRYTRSVYSYEGSDHHFLWMHGLG